MNNEIKITIERHPGGGGIGVRGPNQIVRLVGAASISIPVARVETFFRVGDWLKDSEIDVLLSYYQDTTIKVSN